jgi:outer membrane protein TolC
MQRSRLSRSPRFTIPRWFLAGLTLAALGVSLRGQEAADLQALPVPEEVLPPLESILKTAGERAPELVQIGLDRRIANEELTIARSRLYPSVGVGGNLGYRYVDRQGQDNDSNASGSISIGASRPLYHWGAVNARVRRGEIGVDNSLLSTRKNFQTTIQILRAEYLSLILDQMKLRNLRLQRANLERELENAQSRYDAGEISEEAFLSAQIGLDRSMIAIEETVDIREETLREFMRLSGLERRPEIPTSVPELDLNRIERSLQQGVAGPTWVDQTFTIQTNRNRLNQLEETETIIQSQQRPKVNFSASISQAPVNTATKNNVDTINYFAGLSVNWNVFDGFSTRASRRINLLEQRKLESRLFSQEQELREEEQALRERLLIRLRKQRLAERKFQLDQRIYGRIKDEYGEGRIAENQFRTNQENFYEEEYNLNVARARLLESISEYLVVLNRDRAVRFLEDAR